MPKRTRKPAPVCYPTACYLVHGIDGTEHVMCPAQLDAWMRQCVTNGYTGAFRVMYAHGTTRQECEVTPQWMQRPQPARKPTLRDHFMSHAPIRYLVNYFMS